MPIRTERKPEKSRADLLVEIDTLPQNAFITPAHAAAFIGTSAQVLNSWRSQRRGPPYRGSNDFIRYRISDLELWMSRRADEVKI